MAHKAAAFMYLYTDQNHFSRYELLPLEIVNLCMYLYLAIVMTNKVN